MRSLVSILAAALTTSALFACDTTVEAPNTTQGASSVVSPSPAPSQLDPMLLATCHAAYREAAELIEDKRVASAICLQDSDCTIAVAETACTGEIPAAVNVDAEYAFLGFAARVDARQCATVPAECTPTPSDDAAPLEVLCVANRCTIAAQ